VSGRDVICAYPAGFEAACASASSPGHHAGGWHLTGTLGRSRLAPRRRGSCCSTRRAGPCAGIARRKAKRMAAPGTMCKSFHAGKRRPTGSGGAPAEQGFDSTDER